MRALEIDLKNVGYGAPSHGLNNAQFAVRTQRLPPPLLRSYAPRHTKEALLNFKVFPMYKVINVTTDALYFIAGKRR
jgi:hypothetical protein